MAADPRQVARDVLLGVVFVLHFPLAIAFSLIFQFHTILVELSLKLKSP